MNNAKEYERKKFNVEVGLSDHTISNTASIAAVSLGASAIEKHFILDKLDKSPDSAFSIEPTELRKMKEVTYLTWKALGKEGFNRSKL